MNKRLKHLRCLFDKAYEDKLSGAISDEFWRSKSEDWQNEMATIHMQIKSHEVANIKYLERGSEILELANQASDMYLRQNSREQRKLLDIILSNCTFYRGTLCPTYRKPFDILAKGSNSGIKLGWQNEFINWIIENAA